MDERDLKAALQNGSTLEEAASHLCRSGTLPDVAKKVEELGVKSRT